MAEMPDILAKICRVKRDEIRTLRSRGEASLRKMIELQDPPRGFRAALASSDRVGLIAEIKKASPSAGIIREDFDAASIAREYARGGARCISILTDRRFFGGRLEHMKQARQAADLPILRKDFILDELQLLEARAWGADCALLIAAALRPARLRSLLRRCCGLRMDALVEVHSEEELQAAIGAGADLIGINNRDLHTFEVDLRVTERLAGKIPEGVVKVSESGIKNRADVERLKSSGIDAVLVGEHLMRQENIAAAVRELSEV